MKMCMYILQSREGVYFKSFNPFTNEVEWTGVKERAAFWKSEDVALDQGLYLKLTGHGEWKVKPENMLNNYD